MSKSRFQRYLIYFIIPHTYRIKSFRLSNPFAADMSLLLFPIMASLPRLESLTINNIESDYIEGVINHLSSLRILSSLIIISIDNIKDQNDIYQKIFRLPALKYCQMFLETLRNLRSMPTATHEFSPIEHLVINNKVSLAQLNSLLLYVPQLRRLTLGHLSGYRGSRTSTKSITLNYLTHVSLNLYSVSFDDFESIINDFFHKVEILRIKVFYIPYFTSNMDYLNANRWERLISTHMLNLCIFDFEHQYQTWNYYNDRQAYETQINMFNSLFWIKREWFFENQYRRIKFSNIATFYSTNPYRRKCYIMYEDLGQKIGSHDLEMKENAADHVCIHSRNTMEKFVGNFRNATKLTLSDTFEIPRDSIVRDLNRIIPLEQLSTLSLDCHRFAFHQVIELLNFTPNVHTLKLNSILLNGSDSVSIQQNATFRIVSNTNIVKNMIIAKESTLEKIQLLVAIFPRLEYLTINLYREDLETIARFLLSKPNNNTRHLSLLCISKQLRDLVEKLRVLIEVENLLDDFTLKVIHRKLYLWW
ncbi:unnamed protein product [Rotaria sp. Silwood2]|nr:unnamed protein product [Rotaria sp. Silwood2]CAF4250409.1 unnamed protein product [Rotaria sp. Silwood2]